VEQVGIETCEPRERGVLLRGDAVVRPGGEEQEWLHVPRA